MVRKVQKSDLIYEKGEFMAVYSETSADNFDICKVVFTINRLLLGFAPPTVQRQS